ncbi:cytochrome P450 [Trametes versicolor FP-101664 SS1]|uniref:cytochrome P450 n=1 Tax=Trametes versicolor (strain FP-101664) TaxID=717944 RepID=UPI00046220AB|nr:cytochrome P450 [Trametes versicolor FP-101664 SS1]EIW56884.1 cytochrome P450 [Trametes versicolor FP-101664 SS1]
METFPPVGLVSVLILAFYLFLSKIFTKRTNFPPGPRGLFLLGSAHKLPLQYQEKTFLKWGKQYGARASHAGYGVESRLTSAPAGDVIYLRLFRTPIIILNSFQAATDLLTKRSATYSDRPRMVLLSELMDQASALPPMPYGDRFRKHRRWMHDAVGSRERLATLRSVQLRGARALLRNLLRTPEHFVEHLHLYVAGTMLEVTYGRRITSMSDELVEVADRAIDGINAAGSPGSRIVDFFPILKEIPVWMPGAGFKRRALGVRRPAEMQFRDASTPEDEEDIKGLGCSVYGGKSSHHKRNSGTETTLGMITTFMLAAMQNPEAVCKAQEEIDRRVGKERLPDFGDRASLPYLDAFLEELYRWACPLPLSLPHRAMAKDEYRGYTIPEGSMVMPNIWAMSRDEDAYPEPEEFHPERHLNKVRDGSNPLPSGYVFGFGRRVCPGQAFADATLWIAMAGIMASFDVRPPLNAEGVEVCPPAAFRPGFTRQPEKYTCRIIPRSGKMAKLVMEVDE